MELARKQVRFSDFKWTMIILPDEMKFDLDGLDGLSSCWHYI